MEIFGYKITQTIFESNFMIFPIFCPNFFQKIWARAQARADGPRAGPRTMGQGRAQAHGPGPGPGPWARAGPGPPQMTTRRDDALRRDKPGRSRPLVPIAPRDRIPRKGSPHLDKGSRLDVSPNSVHTFSMSTLFCPPNPRSNFIKARRNLLKLGQTLL